MTEKYQLIKQYLHEMGIHIVNEDAGEQVFVVEDEENGIKNLVIDCEEPILVIEQVIMRSKSEDKDFFKRLLQMNREIVHGAFVLDESGKTIIFRDTLQVENLDRNELEASIKSLSLALTEYGSELLEHAAA